MKGLVVQPLVHEPRPPRHPRFDHQNLPARSEAPRCFRKKSADVGHVMQDVDENDCAQCSIAEGHLLRIGDNPHAGARKNFGSDQTGNEALAISGAGAQLQDGSFSGRQFGSEKGVPLIVD